MKEQGRTSLPGHDALDLHVVDTNVTVIESHM